MDNSLKMAIIILLQREDFDIKKEMEQIRMNLMIEDETKENILKQRNNRLAAVDNLINKIKIDIINGGNSENTTTHIPNVEETYGEDEMKRKIIEEIFGKTWFGIN